MGFFCSPTKLPHTLERERAFRVFFPFSVRVSFVRLHIIFCHLSHFPGLVAFGASSLAKLLGIVKKGSSHIGGAERTTRLEAITYLITHTIHPYTHIQNVDEEMAVFIVFGGAAAVCFRHDECA